jgi:hypothetical protein
MVGWMVLSSRTAVPAVPSSCRHTNTTRLAQAPLYPPIYIYIYLHRHTHTHTHTHAPIIQPIQASISRYLLFLRHVDNIEVYVAHDPTTPDEDGAPQLLYRASREMDDRRAWHEVSAFMTGPPRAPLSKEAFYAKLGSTPVAHLPRVKEMVAVTYQEGLVGFEGQVLRTRRRRVDDFVVMVGLGGGAALAMAVDPKHKHLKFIPL